MNNVGSINVTDKAKKKIKQIANNNSLDYDFVYYLFSFNWNYDGAEGGWVSKLEEDEEYKNRGQYIYSHLTLENKPLNKEKAVSEIYNRLNSIDRTVLYSDFLSGSINKNYCLISEYASFCYLNNATIDKLHTLEWSDKKNVLDSDAIVANVFMKIFRGGAIERSSLEYLYTDLAIMLPYLKKESNAEDWVSAFIKDIENSVELKLSDLRAIVKKYCKGDKYFQQTALEALSYAGFLKVPSHPVENIFIPDYRNELSSNFFANEWAFPLRHWTKQLK